ncbi:MAG: 4-hydroxybenzoyl-CoA thioesterase [Planctomycetes bacterium]|nr:4-hydroxybenzoyl-CoA thioesterase [Planctomycetota bacterium]
MACEFKIRRRVEFAETDMAGILHFSNFFRFMEEAEHAFFRSLDLRVHAAGGAGMWGMARAHAECRYRRPLHYEDVVELHVVVREMTDKLIIYDVVFTNRGRDDVDDGAHESARGSMTAICVAKPAGSDRMRARLLPPEVAERVEAAAPGVLPADS